MPSYGAGFGRQSEIVPAAEYDGGDQDCGSGLLLAITSAMRRVGEGQVLLLRTREPSVLADLPAWARLAGHELLDVADSGEGQGPWRLSIRRGTPSTPTVPRSQFTQGSAAPLGSRLWLYTNFHCNLACAYCCAGSSPKASPKMMSVGLATAATREFVAQGGQELLVTGGEPFLHPDLGDLVGAVSTMVSVTLLTNAMVFGRGARRQALEAMDREAVTLQVSLDSAGPLLHDRQRGAGSHKRAMVGIKLARELGFRVRVAATLFPDDAAAAAAGLHAALDELGIAARDRLIRPVAAEGFAHTGVPISLDTVEPEPTLTVDGAWWHPVAVTNRHLKVAEDPLPLASVLDVMRDVLAVQSANSARGGRSVFRCT